MKSLITTSAFIFFVFFNHANSQILGNSGADKNAYGNAGAPNNHVNLSLNQYSSSFSSLLEANVMMNVEASSYVAIFSLTQYGKTIEEVENSMRTRSEIFKNNLQKEGMEPGQIFFDPVTMIPTYETEVVKKKLSLTYNEVPTGFEMKRNIHITFKKQEQINPIITIAAKAEVYDLVKVDYNISNKEEVINTLRQEALKILLSKKNVLEKAGIFTKFTSVGEMHNSAYPAERYEQYYAYRTGAAPQYLYDQKNKPVQVQYNYAEKNKTLYYEKISDKQFDLVINPVVGEPMVQVYFSLKGQYQIHDPVSENEQKIYNDKVKAIQLKLLELDIDAKKRDIELKGRTVAVIKKQ